MTYPYHQIVILIVIVSLSATIYLSNYSLLSEFKSRFHRLKHDTIEFKQQKQCSMETCFNLTRCHQNGFKIFIHSEPKQILSKIYANIIEYLNKSSFVTNDPNKACLFVLALDTLDRDRLSPHFVRHLDESIRKLSHWNEGENHIVFNLYSGSWPDYIESELEMNTSKAILAKASFSVNSYRVGFDLSFPLFHAELPFNDSSTINSTGLGNLHLAKKYFLTFKGKRYLTGVGSETRNALYHLHNNRDIILLTTCKHGYNWEELKDERCDVDNEVYDKYDYTDLIERSLFCLVPRGRRLGTYRFLEALKSGCVPVLLSNGWVLPFNELLDWQRVVIWADERHLSTLVPRLKSIPLERVSEMSYLGAQFYSQYFSSIGRILQTSLSILQNRIFKTTTPIHSIITTHSNPINIQLSAHQCQLLVFSLNYSIDPSEMEKIRKTYKFIQRIFIVNDSNSFNFSDLDNHECLVVIRYDWLKSAVDENAFRKGFRIWQDNNMSLVGFNGLSYQDGDCHRMSSNLSDGYSFIGLDFTFLHKSYLDLALNLIGYCNDQLVECLTSIINFLAFKAKKANSTILIKLENKFNTFDYSSICLDQMFEDILNLNRTLFTNIILNKRQYFI